MSWNCLTFPTPLFSHFFMKRVIIIFSILICYLSINAQADRVLLSVRCGLINSDYQIITQQNGIYIRENYTYFKKVYWLGKKDTITLNGFIKTDSGYIELKKKKPLMYRYYGSCDFAINKIRNSASYWQMKSKIEDIARSKIGYDNKNFQDFKTLNRLPSDIFHKICNTDYQTIQFAIQQKYLSCIDSLYNDKEKRFSWIKSNKETIDQKYIDSFINAFNKSDPDFRSLKIIIMNYPEYFLNSIYKLSDNDFFSFTLNLDGFPKDMNLANAKSKLEETKNKNRRVQKVIRKMKNIEKS